MTHWDRLQKAISFVNDHGIDVDYRGTADSVREVTNSDLPYNGCAFVEVDQIDLYANNPTRSASQLTAVLIHEFGHIMDYRMNCRGDREKEAWDIGVKLFPKWLVPSCLAGIRKKCLAEYAKDKVY